MAALPALSDPTIDAVRAAAEEAATHAPRRGYLGMSSIGQPCERALWYSFRFAYREQFNADTLWRFDDGHRSEDVMAQRLRMVPGIELRTVDPRTGKQFGFVDLGGHFRGHADGLVRGLLEAPATMHVWEAKASDKVGGTAAGLRKWKKKLGEKKALKKWNEVYYAQAIMYMAYSEAERHYLTCGSAGARVMVGVRTNTDLDEARRLRAKAERVIQSAEPLPKVSDNPAWYECKMCSARLLCHGAERAAVNCRTCAHATPERDGDARWSCAWHKKPSLTIAEQEKGCDSHRFIPALVKLGKAVDANPVENWIEYETPTGKRFRNGEHGAGSYTSEELRHLTDALIGDEFTDGMRRDFGATVVGGEP